MLVSLYRTSLLLLQHTGPAHVRYPQTQRIEVATKEMRWPRKWPNGPNGPGPKWSIGPMAQLGPESAQWPNGQQWYGISTKLYIE